MKSPATLFLVFAGLVLPVTGIAASFATFQAADVVLGQSSFTTGTSSFTPSGMSTPDGVALDPATGKVFVVERSNNRILRFSSTAAALNGSNPEAVLGQPNFTAHSSNQGGGAVATAATLNGPVDVSVDSSGRLWVADSGNNRVLGFYLASYLGSDPSADIVLGQANFTTSATGLTAATMNAPYGVSVGPNDVLWVADLSNNRVLRFDAVTSKANGANANGVLGQLLFGTNVAAAGPIGLSGPGGVCADAAGRLWVGDVTNNRVLRYDAAAAKLDGAAANGVIGQPGFATSASGTGATNLSAPFGVYFDSSTGNLWVSEYNNFRVTRFSGAASLPNTGPAADLVLGQPGFGAPSGAPITAQRLGGPGHIGAGPGGSLFVADYNNNRVLRFSPSTVPPTPKPPLISLKGPAKRTTGASKLTITGLSGDSDGTVVAVKGNVNNGSYTTAKGVSPWKYTAKSLKHGANRIKIRAIDNDGLKSDFVRVTITRK